MDKEKILSLSKELGVSPEKIIKIIERRKKENREHTSLEDEIRAEKRKKDEEEKFQEEKVAKGVIRRRRKKVVVVEKKPETPEITEEKKEETKPPEKKEVVKPPKVIKRKPKKVVVKEDKEREKRKLEEILKAKEKLEKKLKEQIEIRKREIKKEIEEEISPKPVEEPIPEPTPVIDKKEKKKKFIPSEEAPEKAKKKKRRKFKTVFDRKKRITDTEFEEDMGVGIEEQTELEKKVEEEIDKGEIKKVEEAKTKAKKEKEKEKVSTKPIVKEHKRKIKIEGDTIVVNELAKLLNVKANEIIKKLMENGVMATINQAIDYETAALISSEFGFELEKEEDLEQRILSKLYQEDKPEDLKPRPPVVTIMGHVDHGKTTLLDKIRKTKVAEMEAGGITQHIGAYSVEVDGKKITFIDTPGHEAFTAMRARGAKVTDIVILIVAADDGVMPQTVESIQHAQAAEVPIIVAINKIDKPNANPEKVINQLMEYNLVPEEYGGDTLFVKISAKKGEGIDDLLEAILLQAEILELKANPNKRARGFIIESRLDKGRGPVATVLVTEGTLKVGDNLVAGKFYCKVRSLIDDKGKRIKEAGPSTPVEVLGFNGVPEAGEEVIAVESEKQAKELAEYREQKEKERKTVAKKISLEELYSQIQKGELKELNLIVKGDVQGTVDAIKVALEKLSTDEVKVKIIGSGVGGITESDVLLATASNAMIIGFNVRPDTKARKLAEQHHISIKTYSVIYDIVDDIKKAMEGLLEPEYQEVYHGRAEIRQIFNIPKVGVVAGCMVIDGKVTRNSKVRVLRDNVVVYEGELASLKRFKDDVREVQAGYECGMRIENFNDIKEGDIIEAYSIEEVKRKIE